MHGLILLLHILAATVWTGGHLVLSFTILPQALKEQSPSELLRFERAYERIGIPSLVIQVLTGVSMAYRLVPDLSEWFNLDNPVSKPIAAKLLLLAITLGFALDARLRVIPNLSECNLTTMAWHIIPVTILSVLFVVVGVAFRTGWLY